MFNPKTKKDGTKKESENRLEQKPKPFLYHWLNDGHGIDLCGFGMEDL